MEQPHQIELDEETLQLIERIKQDKHKHTQHCSTCSKLGQNLSRGNDRSQHIDKQQKLKIVIAKHLKNGNSLF